MQRKILIILIVLLIATPALAGHKHPEKWYQKFWCNNHNGRTEVVLPGRTRCDCLTDTNAIEFDFAKKWAESIGQALYYSACTGKRAGIVLILEHFRDWQYWDRLNLTISYYDLPIDVWTINAYTSENLK